MVNEILMRGATPVAPALPVEGPQAPASAPADDGFGQALLAELEGPAIASPNSSAPTLAAPRAVSLETMPVTPPVMVAPPPVLPAAAPAAAASGTYTVQAGDSLSKIARSMGHGHWKQLFAANRNTIGANPNMIKPGQVLALPANWQAAAASKVAAAPPMAPVQAVAAVEPPAATPETIGTIAAPPGAAAPEAFGTLAAPPPAAAPAAPTVEAGIEAGPAPIGAAPVPAQAGLSGAPSAREIATEAIDRLAAEPGGGGDHLATLREALKAIPAGDASYEAYKAKVEGYEAAVNMGANGTPLPAMGGAEGAYGPEAPAGAPPTLNAPVLPAEPVSAAPVAPAAAAPAPEDAGDGSAEGEEDWQAFS